MDDYEDRPMIELLRQFGSSVRGDGGPLRARPDLEALHGELDRVDEQEPIRPSPWRPVAALAACLAIGVSLWAFLAGDGESLPVLPGTPPRLLDLALSPTRELLRGGPARPFATGDPVWIHHYTERSGWAVVALLQPPRSARRLAAGPIEIAPDDEPLGPFELRGDPGPAAVVVVSSEVEPEPEQVRRLIATAAAALDGATRAGEEDWLRAVLDAFEAASGLTAVGVPLLLEPR